MKCNQIDTRIEMLKNINESAEYEMREIRKNIAELLTMEDYDIVDCMLEYAKEFSKAYDERKRNAREIKMLESIKREIEQG